MSATAYTPGVDNAPFGNKNTNPQSSQYKTVSGYNPVESILIQKAIRRKIFDASPAQYLALRVLYAKPFKEYGSDEFEYLERTFGRTAIVTTAASAAVAAVPGSEVIQAITFSSVTPITLDELLIYPTGEKAVVRSIVGLVVTVASQTSSGLPAVTIGQVFSIQSTIRGDGQSLFQNYERLDTITRYNFVQHFLRAARWNRIELQKYKNRGTTDYLIVDKEHKIEQIRVDLFNSLWNGTRGEVKLADGTIAKTMGGIYPTMVAAGAQSASPTLAGFQAAFETLAFNTNFKAEGATRFIYGTDAMLHNFYRIYKETLVRYEPDNELANLRLKQISLGTMNFVLIPCQLFQEPSCFPAEWAKKIIVLDQETISPVKMENIPEFEVGETLDLENHGTREDFKDYWVRAQLSLEMNNPPASFWMQIQ